MSEKKSDFQWTDYLVREFAREVSMFAIHAKPDEWEKEVNKFKDKKIKKPLFTTEDGVEMYPNGVCYEIPKNFLEEVKPAVTTWHSLPENLLKVAWEMSDHLYFSTKEAAQEYILFNKPLLSLNDLLNNWSEVGAGSKNYESAPMFKTFKTVAQNKLNGV